MVIMLQAVGGVTALATITAPMVVAVHTVDAAMDLAGNNRPYLNQNKQTHYPFILHGKRDIYFEVKQNSLERTSMPHLLFSTSLYNLSAHRSTNAKLGDAGLAGKP